ncbi:hypothetical protein BH20ACT1_BH20ACT1_12310 [soil metagenome]
MAGLTFGFKELPDGSSRHLTVGDHAWIAPVWFCDPWPLGFHILGQEGFLRWFTVTVRAAHDQLELTPEKTTSGIE